MENNEIVWMEEEKIKIISSVVNTLQLLYTTKQFLLPTETNLKFYIIILSYLGKKYELLTSVYF